MTLGNYHETISRLIKDSSDLQKAVAKNAAMFPLFDISNENSVTIDTDQDDYDPGYYDVLRITPNASISITGLSGGKKGRFLEIINAEIGMSISFPIESASSVAENRFYAPYSDDYVLVAGSRIRLYYDDTLQRWRLDGKPTWNGTYGVSQSLSNLAGAQVIATAGADKKVTFDTPVGVWGWYDFTNNYFVVPADGFYIAMGWGDFAANATGVRYGYLATSGGVAWSQGVNVPCQAGTVSRIQALASRPFAAGDTIAFYVYQSSGGNLKFKVATSWLSSVI